MAKVVAESAQVNARILYWGVEGAGKRSCLEAVRTKLRPDHRGDLSELPTRFDPSVTYAVLPIELGDIGGMRTRIELVAVPGDPGQAPTRKQLLDEVDGIVLVIDAQRDRIDENAALIDELRKSLADYARRLEDLPLVVQYNKRDLSDAYVIDELHRRLGLGNATVFETVASDAGGVLQALSTISKKVIRSLRDTSLGAHRQAPDKPPAPVAAAPSRPAPAPEPEPEPAPVRQPERRAPGPDLELEPMLDESAPDLEAGGAASQLEEAILAEAEGEEDGRAREHRQAAEAYFDEPWHHRGDALDAPLGARIRRGLSIVSVGEATRADDQTVRVPLVLGDPEGETSTLVLSIRLDPLLDESS